MVSLVIMIKGIAKDFYINLKQTDPGRDLIEVASLEDGTRRRLLAEDQVLFHDDYYDDGDDGNGDDNDGDDNGQW